MMIWLPRQKNDQDYSKINYNHEKLAIINGNNAIEYADLNAIIFQPDTLDEKGKLWESRSRNESGKPIVGTGIDCSKFIAGIELRHVFPRIHHYFP